MDTSPHKSDFVHANAIRLHYLDWGGSGEAILFLPGFGDSAHVFDNLAPKFTDRFRVLGLTRRGHPGSDTPETGYDAVTLAEDIRGFLDQLRLGRASLVGHSMASGEITHFAAAYPTRTVKLVYLDAAYDRTELPGILSQDPTAHIAPPESEAEIHASADTYLANFLRMSPRFLEVWSELLDEELRRQIAIQPDGTATDRMPPSIASALWQGMYDYHHEYRAVPAPALAFYAMGGPTRLPDYWTDEQRRQYQAYVERVFIPWKVRSAEQFQKDMANCRIVELPGANHYVFLDKEDIVVRETRNFLLESKEAIIPAA